MNKVRETAPRLPEAYRNWLRARLLPLETPYLFGSGTNMEKRVSLSKLAEIQKDSILKFGGQKLDVLNFTYEEESPFKEMIMMDAIPL